MTRILIIFIALSIVNVVFSTIRSLVTIKGGKTTASLISGGYYAFYNIVLIYTVMNFPMWEKCVITFACNVIGVWIVKFVEEKIEKEKIWKIEVSIREEESYNFLNDIANTEIGYTTDNFDDRILVTMYCYTREETDKVKNIITNYTSVKYFVTENRIQF